MKQGLSCAHKHGVAGSYQQYVERKKAVVLILALLNVLLVFYALNLGSAELTPYQVLMTLLGRGSTELETVIWHIRLPRILAGLIAGAGLSVAGCVMQNNLGNPLAAPSTLGIASAATFGANLAIIFLGAGCLPGTGTETVLINNPYMVTTSAFICAMIATSIILLLAHQRGFSPEAIILAGVALGSLFSASTVLVQYFAQDVQVAAVVFWTFGDLGRASWEEVTIMVILVTLAALYFLFMRWNYNAFYSGEETAKGLGVNVRQVRLLGMLMASLITAVTVSFFGIIGFIGLVGPHIMRRIIGEDYRFLIPGALLMGALLLLAADTIARTIISPVVLPVGALTSFLGAPLFLYLLVGGYRRK